MYETRSTEGISLEFVAHFQLSAGTGGHDGVLVIHQNAPDVTEPKAKGDGSTCATIAIDCASRPWRRSLERALARGRELEPWIPRLRGLRRLGAKSAVFATQPQFRGPSLETRRSAAPPRSFEGAPLSRSPSHSPARRRRPPRIASSTRARGRSSDGELPRSRGRWTPRSTASLAPARPSPAGSPPGEGSPECLA